MKFLLVTFSAIALFACNTSKKTIPPMVPDQPKEQVPSVAAQQSASEDATASKEEPFDSKKYFETLLGKWEMVTLKSGPQSPVMNLANCNIEFRKDNFVGGTSGCNKFGGSFKLIGNRIRFLNLSSTKMACTNMEMEAIVVKYLNGDISTILIRNSNEMYFQDNTGFNVILCRRI